MIKLMCLAGIILFIGGAIFCGWLLAKIMDWRWARKEAKRKKEHPRLFEMVKERNALSCKIGNWYHKEILARKHEIDLLVKEDIYLPADVKVKTKILFIFIKIIN